jgi:hypothetical protein
LTLADLSGHFSMVEVKELDYPHLMRPKLKVVEPVGILPFADVMYMTITIYIRIMGTALSR